MTQTTDQHTDRQTLDALIEEAVGARQMLPPYERCVELNRLLRAAIGDLYLAAQERLGQLPEHRRDWHRVRNALADTDAVLADNLGSGLLSAAIHLGDLARQARTLATVNP
ncbi:DUF6415 family natural product biosynthesis protein [Streptomyces sp. LRE541]|uniref:DUF6415 family natural product biosynthesis protein n=1 Tax=Streptomyces sp. LRE541 TaxID=2931983 RepID=UPI00200BCB5F|nr:DUF6415 family natural product biosynthesis protein [Streptomyces sp. LRE541]UPZ27585.1 DUF6415 family natural product biosynthesis protein [Streptomyces sp. LRE541]